MHTVRNRQTEVAVIGAGIVGLATALRLARAGIEVTLVAPRSALMPASAGNAGIIADYAVMPVGTPDVLHNLPSLLFNRSSPLAIRRSALPALAPWLLRFGLQSLSGRARRNAQALAALLAPAAAEWRDLAGTIGASHLLRPHGSLCLYDTKRGWRSAGAELTRKRALGVNAELVGPAELALLEPNLPPVFHGAAWFPDTISLADPGAMLDLLDQALAASGVQRVHARVGRLERERGAVTLSGDGLRLRAARAVIAAGAWSRPLAAMAGDRVPLDTERGYHLEFDSGAAPVTRPCTPASRGFYFCPMSGRLRVAGTVELGGLHAPPSPHRLTALLAAARSFFPDLPEPSRDWMGFRPSLPDSLPVIGASRAGPEILHAFGHGHLGLTLAPITAALVEAIVTGAKPMIPLAPYRPARF